MSIEAAPSKWRPGMPLTPEMRAKRERTRAESKAARHGKPTAVPSRAPRRQAAPRKTGGVVPDRMVRKIERFVAKVLTGIEGGAFFAIHRTAKPPDAFDADKLEEWERDMLAEAITEEAVRYPRARAVLVRLVELDERSSIAQAVSIIAAGRMLRHGKIPPEFAELVQAMRDAARKARRAPRPREEPMAAQAIAASDGETTTPTTELEEFAPEPEAAQTAAE